MKPVRTILPFVILESLWKSLNDYANHNGCKVSQLFEETAAELINNPIPLAIEPNRRVTIYTKTKQFAKEFPTIRTSMYVDTELILKLTRIYEQVTVRQFNGEQELNVNSLVQTVLYYLCVKLSIPFDSNYFDNEYFKANYTFNDEWDIEAFKKVTRLLEHIPTMREWKAHYKSVGGPSATYIVNKYGSFNGFKELALGIKSDD